MSDPTTPSGWGIQLAKLWLASGQGFPVDVTLLALEVTKQRFPDPIGVVVPHGIAGIDGMLSKRTKHNDWCISYDERVSVPGRVNFTLAHELGHYLLHRKLRNTFQCGEAEMMDYDSPESRRLESQANSFASYLLMPRNDFNAQLASSEISFDLLGHCAQRYQTSLTATVLKWLEFTDEAAMLVVADHDEFICWSFCSQSAKSLRSYKAPGSSVPASALEHLKTVKMNSRLGRRVEPGVWHPTEECIESAVISNEYEQIMFLIRFPYGGSPDHEEEHIPDSFDVALEKASGMNWTR
jgi:Zn-dependent peptidase ImmA (M78 family)